MNFSIACSVLVGLKGLENWMEFTRKNIIWNNPSPPSLLEPPLEAKNNNPPPGKTYIVL